MFTLSERFEQALSMACDFHRLQKRKNLPTPFISHPLSVAALVCENIEFVCSEPERCEDFAIIAILHDVIEDQGGMKAYERIAQAFGKDIADGVLALSDSACAQGDEKPPKQSATPDITKNGARRFGYRTHLVLRQNPQSAIDGCRLSMPWRNDMAVLYTTAARYDCELRSLARTLSQTARFTSNPRHL